MDNHWVIWIMVLAAIVSVQSAVIDDNNYYYNTMLRNQMIEQMESRPNIRYFRTVPKRSTLIWNPLVIALQKALNPEANRETNGGNSVHPASAPKNLEQMTQQPNGKVYWKCYFNAVTCFTKK